MNSSDVKDKSYSSAWLIRLGDAAHNRRFSVTIDHGSSLFRGVEEGDAVLIAGGDPLAAVSFARIYRIRAKLDETTFFFDGVLPVNGGKTLTELGVTAPNPRRPWCDWSGRYSRRR